MHIQNTRESFIMSELIKFNNSDITGLKLEHYFENYVEGVSVEMVIHIYDFSLRNRLIMNLLI